MTRDHAMFAYIDTMLKTKLISYSSLRTLAQAHVATSRERTETTLKQKDKMHLFNIRFIGSTCITCRKSQGNIAALFAQPTMFHHRPRRLIFLADRGTGNNQWILRFRRPIAVSRYTRKVGDRRMGRKKIC